MTDKHTTLAGPADEVGARLRSAALELFRRHGYERTTAAEIAARAGVTERTFFRYFPDKREVLFDGQAVLLGALTTSIADAPEGLGPIDTLFRAFRSTRPLLEGNRAYAKPRHDVIAGTPALVERELTKIAVLADGLAAALVARGVDASRAALAARIGLVAFVDATVGWLDDPVPGLDARLEAAFRAIKSMFDDAAWSATRVGRRRDRGRPTPDD